MDDSLNIITVFNPDSEPYHVKYDGKSYGTIEPNKARRMAKFVAKLNVKHLIDQCINSNNKGDTNNEALRESWAAKIVIDEEVQMKPDEITQEEKIQKDMDRLNSGEDLQRILNKHKTQEGGEESKQTNANFTPPPAQPDQKMPQKPLEEAKPAPSKEETPPASMTPSTPPPASTPNPAPQTPDQPAPETPPQETQQQPQQPEQQPADSPAETPSDGQPTREQLYDYAKNTLAMTLDDEKTKKALDDQDIPQLIKTLGWEPSN